MPRTVKRSKKRKTDDGEGEDNVVYEEYYDYIFPDDETQKPNLKLLQMAAAWRAAQQNNNTDSVTEEQETTED